MKKVFFICSLLFGTQVFASGRIQKYGRQKLTTRSDESSKVDMNNIEQKQEAREEMPKNNLKEKKVINIKKSKCPAGMQAYSCKGIVGSVREFYCFKSGPKVLNYKKIQLCQTKKN